MSRWILIVSVMTWADVEEAYREVLHRLTGNVLKNTEEE